MPRKKAGQQPHKFNEDTRKTVEMMSAVGIPQENISGALKIDPKTLRKYYRDELDHAAIKANAKVGGALFNKAVGGDTSSMIWWTKTRMKWKETVVNELEGDLNVTLVRREIVRPKDQNG